MKEIIATKTLKFNKSPAGMVNSALLPNGVRVNRAEALPIQGVMVPCASYDNHFLYDYENKEMDVKLPMCTCGEAAVVVGYQVYKKDASLQKGLSMEREGEDGYFVNGVLVNGGLWVCLYHQINGKHQNSG